jgi:hypothetical protein
MSQNSPYAHASVRVQGYPHVPGSPFRPDYQAQVDWSDLATNAKRANTPTEGRPGWGKGTVPGLGMPSDPGKAGRIRKATALG